MSGEKEDASSGLPNTDAGGGTLGDQLVARGVRVEPLKTGKNKAGAKAAPAPPKFMFRQPPALPQLGMLVLTPGQREENRRAFEAFIAEAGPQMHDYITQLRMLDEMSDEERQLYAEAEKQLIEAVSSMLSCDEPYKTPVRLAWADALVRTCPVRRGPVTETIERLTKESFLVVVENGDQKANVVRIYSKNYTLGVELRKNPQAQVVLEALNQLVGRTAEHGREVFQDQLAELQRLVGESSLSPAELRSYIGTGSGKDGRIILPVPDKVRERDGRFFKGGPVLVEVHEGKVRILDGAGTVQRTARQIGESETFLGIGQLANERVNLGSAQPPPEVFNRIVAIHDMVRRGLAAAEEAEVREARKAEQRAQVDAEREELKSKADLTPEEFFLEKRVGTIFFDFGRKPFGREKRENGKAVLGKDDKPEKELFWDVICLVERRMDGQIRVAECPDRLRSFFGGACDWTMPEERFQGLPYPLGVLLRIGFKMALDEQ